MNPINPINPSDPINTINSINNNFYGDVAIGLGTTINAVTIGVCLYYLFKENKDISKNNQIYIDKEKQLCFGCLVLTMIFVVVYFIMNYFVVRKESEKSDSRSGWFDWIYFVISFAGIFIFWIVAFKLNPCAKFVSSGQFGTQMMSVNPTLDI
jgi:hypothetical protein